MMSPFSFLVAGGVCNPVASALLREVEGCLFVETCAYEI